MRNLYSRLGISPNSSEHDIRSALDKCANSTLRDDVREVLLNLNRRRNYDRVHATLRDIGSLRAHLGLNYSDNWRSPESDDFSTEPVHSLSLHDELISKVRHFNKRSKAKVVTSSIQDLFYGILRLAAAFGGIAGVIWMISASDDASRPLPTPSNSYVEPEQPAFSEPVLPTPTSGSIRRFTGAEGVAPLEIRTNSGSNYLVRLEDISTGADVLDVFVRGGSVTSIEVPLGTYRLKYASGNTWYGYEHYFGPTTGYNQADSDFRFYEDGNRVSGYTVTLYQVQNGNLRTSRLPPNQF